MVGEDEPVMQVTLEKSGRDTVELVVIVPAQDVTEQIKRGSIMVAYQKKVTPDPARTPLEVLSEQLGADVAKQLIDEQIMQALAPFALAEKSLDIVGIPKFFSAHHAEKGKDFSFAMKCVPVPHCTLASYDPVEITIPPLVVTSEEIKEQMEAMAQQNSVQATDETRTTVRKGDEVELAMETTKEGVRLKALCARSRPYKTGAFTMPDAFDEAIIGMEVGETKTFSFEGPSFELDKEGNPLMEHYSSTVTLKRLLKDVVPAITDAWVKENVPDCNTTQELESKIERTVYAQKEIEYNKQKNRLVANELAKRFDEKISDAVYEAAIGEAQQTFTAQLEQQGLTLEEFLKKQNMEEQQMSMALMVEARDQLVRQLVLNALAEHLDLVVTDEDYDAYFASIAAGKEAQARSEFVRNGRMFAARGAALRLKANIYLSEHAIVHQASAPTA